MIHHLAPVRFPSFDDPVFKQALKGWDLLGTFNDKSKIPYLTFQRNVLRLWRKKYRAYEFIGFIHEDIIICIAAPKNRPVQQLRFNRIPYSQKIKRPKPLFLPNKVIDQISLLTATETYFIGDIPNGVVLSSSTRVSQNYSYVSSNNVKQGYLSGTRILAPKAYSFETRQLSFPILEMRPLITSGYHKRVKTSSYAYQTGFPQSSVIDTRALAVTRCLLRIKDMDVNLGAAIGEGKQTLSLLLDSIRRLSVCASSLKRGDLPSAIKSLGLAEADLKRLQRFKSSSGMRPSASSLWLELQYGWLPLMGDIHGIFKFIKAQPRLGVFKFSATANDKSTLTGSNKNLGWGSLTATHTAECSSHAKCVIYAEIENPFIANLSSLGLTNPFSVAWELIPFSFVVDWLLPVGKFLDTLDAGLGWKFLSGTTSLRHVHNCVVDFSSTSVSLVSTGPALGKVVTKQRSVLTSFPKPNSIRIKDPRSRAHYLNSIALLRQLTKKG